MGVNLMQKIFLWLSGFFTTFFLINSVRVLFKVRVAVNFHRVPLKVSLIIAVVALILAVVFYFLSLEKNK
jgi:hypothetical protein